MVELQLIYFCQHVFSGAAARPVVQAQSFSADISGLTRLSWLSVFVSCVLFLMSVPLIFRK